MTEDLGGISVHIDIEDLDVQRGLDAIEEKLKRLQGETHTVTLQIDEAESGGTGGATKGRPRKTTIMAALALEKNAEANLQKQVGEFKLTAPVELTLAQGTIDALQKQIQEAFANFRVSIKVNYEGDAPSEEAVPGTNGSVMRTTPQSPQATRTSRPARTGPTRIIQPPPQAPQDDAASLRRQVEAGRKVLQQAALDPNSSQSTINKLTAKLDAMDRRANIAENTPQAEVVEQGPRTLVGRKRGARPKRGIVRRPSYQPPPGVRPDNIGEEASSGTLSSYDMHRRTALARYAGGLPPRPGLEGPREGTLTAGTGESELETEGELLREEQRRYAEARRLALGPIASGEQKFAPGERQHREFDRRRLMGQRQRRRGPTRRMGLGANPIVRGGLVTDPENTRVRELQEAEGTISRLTVHGERPGPLPGLPGELREFSVIGDKPGERVPVQELSQVGVPTRDVEDRGARGGFDPRGRYAANPAIAEIQRQFERGEFGTPDAPLLGILNAQGEQTGERRAFTEADRRYLDQQGLSSKATQIVRRRHRPPAEILSPRILALQELAKITGSEGGPGDIGEFDKQKFLETIEGRSARPGQGVLAGPGGYVGVGTVGGEPAGPAAETTAQSRARLERARVKEVLASLDPETRASAMALLDGTPGAKRRFNKFLQPFRPELRVAGRSAPEERRLRRELPVDFGPAPEIDTFFERAAAGDADISDIDEKFLPRDNQGNQLQITPRSAYEARLRQFGASRREKGLTGKRRTGLNPAQEEQVAAHRAYFRSRQDEIDKASTAAAGRDAIDITRPARRDFTEPETELANAQSRIEQIVGSPGSFRQLHGTNEANRRQLRRGGGTIVTPKSPGELLNVGYQEGDLGRVYRGDRAPEGPPDALQQRLISLAEKRAGGDRTSQAESEYGGGTAAQLGITESLKKQDELVGLLRRVEELKPVAAAARQSDIDRGAKPGTFITTSRVSGGDEFREAVAKRSGIQLPQVEAQVEPEPLPRFDPGRFQEPGEGYVDAREDPTIPTPPRPVRVEDLRARVEAGANTRYAQRPESFTGHRVGEQVQGQIPMFEEEQPAIRLAAGEREAGLGGRVPGEGLTATASGGIVPVDIQKSIELNVKVAGGAAGARRAAAEREPGTAAAAGEAVKPGESKEQIAARKLRAATTANLDRQLREQFPDFELERPERLASTGKSEARIDAEAKILEARALNPTRAFQTAVAAGFAKTLGGGGEFEGRVKTLTKALGEQASSVEGVAQTRSDLSIRRRNLQGLIGLQQQEVAGLRASGVSEAEIPKQLNPALERRIDVAREERAEAGAEAVAARRRRAEANRGVAGASGRNLISPLGVARGFAALGGGAIVGGLIFRAASQAVEAGASAITAGLEKAADALSGFAITANRVNAELASAVRGAAGSSGAIAGAAAPTGINLALFNKISGPLEQRAQAQAAAQNQAALGDLLKTASFNNRGGFDRALFEGTGGFLGGSLGAPQQGFTEQLANNLEAVAGQQRYKALSGEGQTGGGVYGQRLGRIIQAGTDTGAAGAFIKDLGKNLEKVNSEFVVLAADSAPELVESFKKSAEAVGDLENANKLLANGLVIGRRGGGGLEGTEYGSAAADLARGQNLVNPQVAFQQGQRQMEAQVRDLRRRRDYALGVSLPRQQGLQSLLQPQRAPGTGLNAANAEEAAKLQVSTAQTVKLQADLNTQYVKGQSLLKDVLPADLFSRIKNTGEEILRIQTNLANAQAKLQTAEYTNQLRIAKRTLSDLVGLTGKVGQGEASQLGVLEKQNLLLSRRAALIQLELQQRSLNFQRAVAGFSTPGQTPEEIAARRRDAETQVSFAQELLDIGKQTNANQIKIVDEQNIRALKDAVASILLLEQARMVTFDAALAQEQLDALGKQLDADAQRAGAYITEVEGAAAIAFGKIAELEAAYGKAIGNVTLTVIRGFLQFVSGMKIALNSIGTSTGFVPGLDPQKNMAASGALFNTSGTTSMIVGEAGTETVAVLRNPRTASISGAGGGGGVTININGPVVKDEGDIAKIARAVEEVLNRRAALLGLR